MWEGEQRQGGHSEGDQGLWESVGASTEGEAGPEKNCGGSWVPADAWLDSKVPAGSGHLPNSLWWPPGDHAGKMVRAPIFCG